jgi:hypothetical protein
MVTADDILGSWLMVDRGTDSEEDQAQAKVRYGDDPQGFMIFAPDGWMNAIVCWGGRPPLTGNPAWHTDAPDDERLRAFDTYLSYGGQYKVENSVLTTRVSFALNPSWVGGDQVRGLEMTDDGHLILTLSRAWPDGRVMTGWVKWKRAND